MYNEQYCCCTIREILLSLPNVVLYTDEVLHLVSMRNCQYDNLYMLKYKKKKLNTYLLKMKVWPANLVFIVLLHNIETVTYI